MELQNKLNGKISRMNRNAAPIHLMRASACAYASSD
jgi:hypothetical protein